jgi:hypothetical protein
MPSPTSPTRSSTRTCPSPPCGTFEVRDGRIVLWRDTSDWTSGLVNVLIAGPLYLLRRISMTVALKVAARKG